MLQMLQCCVTTNTSNCKIDFSWLIAGMLHSFGKFHHHSLHRLANAHIYTVKIKFMEIIKIIKCTFFSEPATKWDHIALRVYCVVCTYVMYKRKNVCGVAATFDCTPNGLNRTENEIQKNRNWHGIMSIYKVQSKQQQLKTNKNLLNMLAIAQYVFFWHLSL